MASGTTYQAIKRLAWLPEREANENGSTIGGQEYDDVYFYGGEGHNLRLIDCIITPSGGGGGVTTETFVNSGLTGNAVLNGFLGFRSATVGTKTANVPTPTGTLNIIIIADLIGTATEDTPINVVPTSGSIIGNQNQLYAPYSTMTLLDTSAGYVVLP